MISWFNIHILLYVIIVSFETSSVDFLSSVCSVWFSLPALLFLSLYLNFFLVYIVTFLLVLRVVLLLWLDNSHPSCWFSFQDFFSGAIYVLFGCSLLHLSYFHFYLICIFWSCMVWSVISGFVFVCINLFTNIYSLIVVLISPLIGCFCCRLRNSYCVCMHNYLWRNCSISLYWLMRYLNSLFLYVPYLSLFLVLWLYFWVVVCYYCIFLPRIFLLYT